MQKSSTAPKNLQRDSKISFYAPIYQDFWIEIWTLMQMSMVVIFVPCINKSLLKK